MPEFQGRGRAKYAENEEAPSLAGPRNPFSGPLSPSGTRAFQAAQERRVAPKQRRWGPERKATEMPYRESPCCVGRELPAMAWRVA